MIFCIMVEWLSLGYVQINAKAYFPQFDLYIKRKNLYMPFSTSANQENKLFSFLHAITFGI